MSVRLKSEIYETVVHPVVLYYTECFGTTTDTERHLHAIEMPMVRCIVSISLIDHVTSVNVRHKFSMSSITEKMREDRMLRYGHIFRAAPTTVGPNSLPTGNLRPCGPLAEMAGRHW